MNYASYVGQTRFVVAALAARRKISENFEVRRCNLNYILIEASKDGGMPKPDPRKPYKYKLFLCEVVRHS